MHCLVLLVRVSRPLSWILVAVLFGLGLAISDAKITAAAVVHMLLASVLLPLVVFGVNDIYDYGTDSVNKRKQSVIHGTALGLGHHRFVATAALASTVVLAVFSALTQNIGNMAFTAVAISLAWAYSEPPIRLKEVPLLDSLSNAALVFSVIAIGYSYGKPVSSIPPSVYFASLGASAIHALGAIMDYSADKRAGIRTIATFFGKRLAAVLALSVTLAILAFSGIRSFWLRLFFWYATAALGILVVKDGERLARKLFMLAFVAALASMALFTYQQFFK